MNVALVGYGAMGQMVHKNFTSDMTLVGKVGLGELNSLFDIKEKIDVIIDFSNPVNLDMIIDYCTKNNTPVVIATTGYSDEQKAKISDLGKKVPVLWSSNYSLGVILLNRLVKQITPILKDNFDIEVIEAHHNKKIDAPSGTAKMLVKSICDAGDFKVVNGREGVSKREPYKEVGVHAVRGGTIVGEHEVMFCGNDEIISLKHSAHSKAIFAVGAIKGAKWLLDKSAALYDMEDVLFGNN